ILAATGFNGKAFVKLSINSKIPGPGGSIEGARKSSAADGVLVSGRCGEPLPGEWPAGTCPEYEIEACVAQNLFVLENGAVIVLTGGIVKVNIGYKIMTLVKAERNELLEISLPLLRDDPQITG